LLKPLIGKLDYFFLEVTKVKDFSINETSKPLYKEQTFLYGLIFKHLKENIQN